MRSPRAREASEWRLLQKRADDLGLAIRISHFPPGTSKWNKIEHRPFCHITQSWRGRPLRTFETVVELIGNTHTAKKPVFPSRRQAA